mmetsp:Transcript_11555/g.28999  ORF Transcript_11555/g.28999 Transcript_11555/m.28999 type:complete len:123 (-) Transcript_11555:278-646(-)
MQIKARRPIPTAHFATSRLSHALVVNTLLGTDDSTVARSKSALEIVPKHKAGTPYSTIISGAHHIGLMICMHRMLMTVATKMSMVRKVWMPFSDVHVIDADPASNMAPREAWAARSFWSGTL